MNEAHGDLARLIGANIERNKACIRELEKTLHLENAVLGAQNKRLRDIFKKTQEEWEEADELLQKMTQ